MNGSEHYRLAERLAGNCAIEVAEADGEDVEVNDITRANIALAQVHATLALAAATAAHVPFADLDAWKSVLR